MMEREDDLQQLGFTELVLADLLARTRPENGGTDHVHCASPI
jgi:hypothetical protein